MRKIIFSLILISLGILFRTIWHLGPNVEFVTTASILAAIYLGGSYAIVIPLLIMILTDKVIGNTNIYFFTWSAYLIIGLLSFSALNFIKKKLEVRSWKLEMIKGSGMGILAAIFFFLWTNFGVWALDSWGMYTRDFSGLIRCYIMGLPFLKLNLLGNLIFIPISIFIVENVKSFLGESSTLKLPQIAHNKK